jgi:hypothetical protein
LATHETFFLFDVKVQGRGDVVDRLLQHIGERTDEGLRSLVADADDVVATAVGLDQVLDFSDQVRVDASTQTSN